MSVFSICDHENEVQLLDKTRFDAQKSFWSKGSNEISALTIKPSLDGSAIDCFSSNRDEWYLDWAFASFSIDVDSTNSDLTFNEGGSDITASLTAGTYTLAQYATELQTQLNAESAYTYTVSVSSLNKITVSTTVQFQFKSSPVQEQCFFELDEIKTEHVSSVVEYGKRIVTVTCSNVASETDTKYFYINVYSKVGDYLFSQDGDLMAHEPDIMKWVTHGRSSFINVHRRAQKLIMNWIDEKGYVNTFGDKYIKRDIVDISEVNVWSTYLTLKLIFQGLSNSIDDIFDRKAGIYESLENGAKQRVALRLDVDKDGVADEGENLSIYSGSLYKR
jgi:hypothetical protein